MPVYFVVEKSNKPNLKIGYSRDSNNRLSSLQTGNPNKLILLWTFEAADRGTEKEIHKALEDYRLQGEWFKWCREVMVYLDNFIFDVYLQTEEFPMELEDVLRELSEEEGNWVLYLDDFRLLDKGILLQIE